MAPNTIEKPNSINQRINFQEAVNQYSIRVRTSDSQKSHASSVPGFLELKIQCQKVAYTNYI